MLPFRRFAICMWSEVGFRGTLPYAGKKSHGFKTNHFHRAAPADTIRQRPSVTLDRCMCCELFLRRMSSNRFTVFCFVFAPA